MELTKSYLTSNNNYATNTIIDVTGLVLHSVGCPQPDPGACVAGWNTSSIKYLAHMVIGTEEGYIVLPCMEENGKAARALHVGSANNWTIGVEMTEPSSIRYKSGADWEDLDREKTEAHVLATYKNAVDVFAQLCIFHNLDPLGENVILSHRECHKKGIGTNHADPEHLWRSFGLSMDQFRQDVNAAVQAYNKKNKKKKNKVPYKVRVSIDNLNIRIGPNRRHASLGFIEPGIYTIVEKKGKWGRLKAKQPYNGELVDAWINTMYTKKFQ